MESEDSTNDKLCKLCNKSERHYVCPKCGIGYCSSECYKSTAHSECSEMFYKQCVQEELRAQERHPEMKQKTEEMLQRFYKEHVENDDTLSDILREEEEDYSDGLELDSDDEDVPPLEKRLENINLDNADELWSALTATEKQEFEALIQSGEASELLPLWKPWWSYTVPKKLVKDVEQTEQEKTYTNDCPKILNIPELESVTNVSPLIRFNIINTVYAYAYTVLYFNGEHQSTSLDAVYVFLRICDTVRINRVFKNSSTAIENILLEITNCEALSADQETILETKKAGDAILNGPEEENKSFYLLAALSDLHELLCKVKKEISITKSGSINPEFKTKFQSNIDLGQVKVSKKNILLFIKKIEFYVAWLKSQSQNYDITAGEEV